MSELSIEVRGTDALLLKIPQGISTRPVIAAGAGEYKRLWRDHFKTLDAKGNVKGWPAKHFWISEGLMKTEVTEIDAQHGKVECQSAAVAYQANGGTIRPRTAKAIAVPLTATAYAAGRPSISGLPLEFVRVRSVKFPNLIGKLVEARATTFRYGKKGVISKSVRENTDTAGTAHYLLFTSITKAQGMGEAVKPEPSYSQSAVSASMAAAVQRQIDRKQDKG